MGDLHGSLPGSNDESEIKDSESIPDERERNTKR
jgi:hypothetical protein